MFLHWVPKVLYAEAMTTNPMRVKGGLKKSGQSTIRQLGTLS